MDAKVFLVCLVSFLTAVSSFSHAFKSVSLEVEKSSPIKDRLPVTGFAPVVVKKWEGEGDIVKSAADSMLLKGDSIYIAGKCSRNDGSTDALLLKYNMRKEDFETYSVFSFREKSGKKIKSRYFDIAAGDDRLILVGQVSDGGNYTDILIVESSFDCKILHNWTWSIRRYDSYPSVCVDEDDVYIVGTTGKGGEGNHDIFISKFSLSNDNLSLKWFKTWGGDDDEFLPKIVKHGDFLYICGYTFSGSVTLFVKGVQLFLLKCDLEGNILWERIVRSFIGATAALDIYVDDNAVYLCGSAATVFNPINATILLYKYSLDGKLIWRRHNEKNLFTMDALNGLTEQDGFIFCVGNSMNLLSGKAPLIIAKYRSKNGRLVQLGSWSSGEAQDVPCGIAFKDESFFYVVGTTIEEIGWNNLFYIFLLKFKA